MKRVILRNIPPDLQKAIRARAKQKRISMSRAVLELLQEHVEKQKQERRRVYKDLDHLAGTWSDAEADEFDKILQEQRRV